MTAYLNRLCDMQDSLLGCSSQDQVWSIGLDLFKAQGSSCFTSGSAPRDRHDAAVVRTNLAPPLMRDYVSEKIHVDDPWMQYCASNTEVDSLDVMSGTRSEGTELAPRLRTLFESHGFHRVSLFPCSWRARIGGVALYATDSTSAGWFDAREGQATLRLMVALFAALYQPGMEGEARAQLYTLSHPMSPREIEVLQWVASGLRTAQISHRMGLRDVTVSKHLQSLRRKLGARTTEQALAIALRDGLLPL